MIDSYSFGNIIVDGKSFDHDLIILPGRTIDWWREEGHTCALIDLEAIKEEKFDVLIIGTGHSGLMKVLPEVSDFFKKKGVKVIAKDTKSATEEYNRLSKEKKVVGAFHLTC